MQVALRKGNADALAVEAAVDLAVQFVQGQAAQGGLRDPYQQLEVEAGFAKCAEPYPWSRVLA